MMVIEEKCHFYSFTSLLRLTTHFSSTKITNINPDATCRDIDALSAVDKKKKTVNVSKVGRVNEFPYQIRAASCHESLLLSLSSINSRRIVVVHDDLQITPKQLCAGTSPADIHLYRDSLW